MRSKPRLQTLPPRVPTLGATPRAGPWQKSELTPKRRTGEWLMKRNRRIKDRDQWTCQICGTPTDQLEIDHIIPMFQGGEDEDSNLQSLCAGPDGCHARKSKSELQFARM